MAYISGIGTISPQPTFGNAPYEKSLSYLQSVLNCVEPDYNEWIDQRSIRRMSRVIRMGVTAANHALREAGITVPDAIITGTGFGCIVDTSLFLNKLIENNESALNPTPFIQSTHNTIGSQIALLLQCYGYNQTYSHRGFSFERALQDALMQLTENPQQNILVGAVDEITEVSADFLRHLNLFTSCENSLRLFDQTNSGTIHGEGASFFVINNSKENAWCRIAGLATAFKPKYASDVEVELHALLKKSGIDKNDIDLIILGRCGDEKFDSILNEVSKTFHSKSAQVNYKNLCGEYSTTSSFALWIATMAMRKNFIPKEIIDAESVRFPIKNVLIYNHYLNQHHSLLLLQSC
jgi:3-oxoacyl-[acyl-carrier-protein] synthase II